MSSSPAITIVTAVLNGSAHLERCLSSVRDQTLSCVEHVILDGGSHDGTLDILHRWSKTLAHWRSEPDGGIADAMNKGLAEARGEWLLFLQSDDYLCDPSVLALASARFDQNADVQAFPVFFGGRSEPALKYPRGANFWLNFKTGIFHQGAFIRRSLFERIGSYDDTFKIAMDYEFFLRAYRAGARFACHEGPAVSLMGDEGVSSQRDRASLERRFAEEKRAHEKHKPSAMTSLYTAYWAMYPLYRRFLRSSYRT